uniref:Isochorismatase-like domain-containing protein n=1 Tax=Pyrodinium bahamense TaxID=73915 RepID=A0A7S0FK60_9DINO|mmetsp:Transcript_36519/g.101363  ORF Transcript_36519/g.101363 Transcript_36519/m.101363 type:complete len:221 (+) Transcript_36519:49-711(+)
MSDRVFAPDAAKGGQPIEPGKTALVFIEYQNEFTTEGGKLHGAVKGVMEENGMLGKSAEVAAKAREKGCKVIHMPGLSAPISLKEDMSDNPNKGLGILAGCAGDKLFLEGSWNAEFCAEMKPQEGDLIVEGKKGLDAFPGTNLEKLLVENGIESVVLGGFLTNCCVESTMRTAYEKGFNVVTLTDFTATTSPEGQQGATGGTDGMFSKPMTKDEFLATMG